MAQPLRVLLIDAPSLPFKALAQVLRSQGFRVAYRELSEHLASYVALAASSDVVLMTTLGRQALPLCSQLRRVSGPELPILLLGDPSDAANLGADGTATGATSYLAPPFSPETVLEMLRAGLPSQPAETEAEAEAEAEAETETEAEAATAAEPQVEPGLESRDARAATSPMATTAPATTLAAAPAAAPATTPARPLQPPRGVLSSRQDVASVLATAALQQITGRLDLTGDGAHADHVRQIYFERGMPVDAAGNDVGARLESVLRRQGKLTAAQHGALQDAPPGSARALAARLVAEGVLKPEELSAALRAHLLAQVVGCFAWEAGSFQYVAQVTPQSHWIRLHGGAAALLLEGIRRKYDAPRLIAALGSVRSMVTLVEPADGLGAALGLAPALAAMVPLLDGLHTLEDVAAAVAQPPLEICQIAYVLVLLRLAKVTVLDLGQADVNSAEGDAIDRSRILAKYDQVIAQDYFDILGIDADASDYEVRQAHASLADSFASRHFSATIQQQMRAQLEEIAEVLADAQAVLQAQPQRQGYAAARLGAGGR